MRPLKPWLALFALLLPLPRLAGSSLLVLNKSDNTAVLVDADTYQVAAKLSTGVGPHEAAVSPDGRFAYVANYGTRGDPGKTLTVIDLRTKTVARTIDLGEFRRPHGIRVSRDGKIVWVTCEDNQAVIGVDTKTDKVVESFVTGQQVSHMLVPSADEKKLYVANTGPGNVTVVDRSTKAVKHLTTGLGAQGIDLSPDGRWVWVTNRAANTLSVIDTGSDTVTESFSSGGQMPIRVKFQPDGKAALVSNARSNKVMIFDVATRKLIDELETGSAPAGILITPDSKRAFVANTVSNQVSVIDLGTRKIIHVISPGTVPDGMAWVP
jgi:YVTN family beta-propeller protein